MATITVTVPDSEAEVFLAELLTLHTRIIKAERLSPAVEASNAQRDKFMNTTNYITGRH